MIRPKVMAWLMLFTFVVALASHVLWPWFMGGL